MRLLLALDGSDVSMNAADFLTRLPWPVGTEVTVLSVIVDTAMGEIDAEVWMSAREAAHRGAVEHFQRVSSELNSKFAKVEFMVVEGHPTRVILEVAKQQDVDVVVLGARGHSLVARALLGSTSDYVANHARCPVLVVRPRTAQADQAAADRDGGLRIILAYDGSPGAKLAAEQLFAFAWTAKTKIQLTTLLERPHLIPDEEVYDEAAIAANERNLVDLMNEVQSQAQISYRVRETVHVGDTLAHLADTEHGDLIFVGDTGRSALAQFFLGSAARHVLHHSSSSVWVARKKQWH